MILSNEENTVLDGVEGHVILSHLLEVPWYSFKSLGDRTKVVALHFYPWTLISIENIPNNQYREKISNLLLEATAVFVKQVVRFLMQLIRHFSLTRYSPSMGLARPL